MNLKSLISPQYLFQVNTAFISPQEKLFMLFGAISVLLAIVLKISSALAPIPVDAKYRQKLYKVFLFFGLSELVWYLCRYENVTFFDTPFVAWLLVLISVVWLVIILVSAIKNYGKEKMVWEKEQLKLRYLPK